MLCYGSTFERWNTFSTKHNRIILSPHDSSNIYYEVSYWVVVFLFIEQQNFWGRRRPRSRFTLLLESLYVSVGVLEHKHLYIRLILDILQLESGSVYIYIYIYKFARKL